MTIEMIFNTCSKMIEKILIGLLTVSVTIMSSVGQQFPTPNLVRYVGSSATFQCVGLANDNVTWYVAEPSRNVIFISPATLLGDPAKYLVNTTSPGSYTLTVLNLNLDDGDTYACRIRPSRITTIFTNLVVITTPTLTVTPNNTYDSTDLNLTSVTTGMVGDTVVFQCLLLYGAPTVDDGFYQAPLDPNQDPGLSLFFGGNNITNLGGTGAAGINMTAYRAKALSVVYTYQSSDVGTTPLTCGVTTTAPPYNDSVTVQLNITNYVTTAVTTAVPVTSMIANQTTVLNNGSANNSVQLGAGLGVSFPLLAGIAIAAAALAGLVIAGITAVLIALFYLGYKRSLMGNTGLINPAHLKSANVPPNYGALGDGRLSKTGHSGSIQSIGRTSTNIGGVTQSFGHTNHYPI